MGLNGIRYYLVLIVMSVAVLLSCYDNALSADRFVISIPAERIVARFQARDRVSEYTIEISAGRIYGVLKIPEDWVIKIEDRPETPSLNAYAGHGASYLTIENIKKGAFNNFLIIEAKRSDWGPLDIKARFTVDVFMEEQEKHILIEKKDIVITPVKE